MRVLMVDDDIFYVELIGELLGELGHEVVLAGDGKQGREILEMESVDLIISDVYMPTLDGLWFHSYVREFSTAADVPFIFVSGIDSDRSREGILDPAIDYFVSKSRPVADLVALVEKVQREKVNKAKQG
jgi:DNA-binding response OmpR family regulator